MHSVSRLSQWHNGRNSRDTMVLHEQSALSGWRRRAKARLSERLTEELTEIYRKEDWNAHTHGYSNIENKAALV